MPVPLPQPCTRVLHPAVIMDVALLTRSPKPVDEAPKGASLSLDGYVKVFACSALYDKDGRGIIVDSHIARNVLHAPVAVPCYAAASLSSFAWTASKCL
eukprot:1148780-Pelagomonas_calceolata.AAC.3